MNSMKTFMDVISKMNGSVPKYKVGQFVKVNSKRLSDQLCMVIEVHPNHLVVESEYWICNVPMKFIEPMKLTPNQIEAMQEAAADTFTKWG